jgi:adenosylhomocysteine nucleosidase
MNGIITIFESEFEALKDYSLIEDIQKLAHRKYFSGRLNEQQVVFTHIENDPLNLAIATQIMIDHYKVKRILFTCQATPLVPYIKTGDIIVAKYLVQAVAADKRSAPMLEADDLLLNTIRTVCDTHTEDRPPHIFGTILHPGYLEEDTARIRILQQEYGALGIDAGGTAIAHVCILNEIPFAALEIAVEDADSGTAGIREKIERACKEVFEIKGMALVDLTVTAFTTDI